MSKKTLATAMAESAAMGKHGRLYTSSIPHRDNNYNYNLLKNLDVNNNNQDLDPPTIPNGRDYNYSAGQKPVSPAKIVATDPAFKMAVKDWGMWPGSLVNLCKKHGISMVRKSIQFVMGIDDRYFMRSGLDIDRQRGAYTMQVINSGGPKYL